MEKASSPPSTAFSLGNGPILFNDPLLFVIPSEAEGSAVRRSGAPNLSLYDHFPFVVPRQTRAIYSFTLIGRRG
jgi:hypothetical protein